MMPKRPRKVIQRKQTLLIACEGSKTEWHYFSGLCQEQAVRDRFAVTLRPGSGGDARSTVADAVKERNRAKARDETFDEVWCVLDVETVSKETQLKEALDTIQREKFSVVLSNPSFEVWLIAHFERTSRGFQDSKAAENYLTTAHWRPHFACDYDKGMVHLYKALAGRLNSAVENAQWILEVHHGNGNCENCNSSTEVYRLVKKLLDPV